MEHNIGTGNSFDLKLSDLRRITTFLVWCGTGQLFQELEDRQVLATIFLLWLHLGVKG
jgi:hypothetical protein